MADAQPILVNYQGKPTPLEDLPDEVLEDPKFAETLRLGGVIKPTPSMPLPESIAPAARGEAPPGTFRYRPPGSEVAMDVPIEDVRAGYAPEEWMRDEAFATAFREATGQRPTPPTPMEAPAPRAAPAPAVADGNGAGPIAQLQRLILGAAPVQPLAAPDFSIIGPSRLPGGRTDRPTLGFSPSVRPEPFPTTLAPGPQGAEKSAAELAGQVPADRPGVTTFYRFQLDAAGNPSYAVSRRVGPEGEPLAIPSEEARTISGEASFPTAPAQAPQAPARFLETGVTAPPRQAPAAPVVGQPAGQTPRTQQILERGFELQRQAAGEAATIGARVEEARRAGIEGQAQEARRAQAEQEALAKAQRDAGVKAEQDYRLAVEEMKTPAGAINPARWWQNADTGTRILAGISAFMSGLAGGRNPVDTIIERDIAAQKDALDRLSEGRRAQVQAKLSLLGAMRARFGDEQSALAAARAAAYEAAGQEARQLEAKATQGAAKAKATEVVGTLEAKRSEALGDLAMRQAQMAALRTQTAMDQAKLQALQAPPTGELTKEQRERAATTIHGQTVLAFDHQAAKDLRQATAVYGSMLDNANRIIQLREKYGSEHFPGKIAKDMEGIRNALLLDYKNAKGLGAAFTPSEQAMVEAVTGGDPARIGFGVLDQLKNFRDALLREYNNKVESLTGARPFAGGARTEVPQ